MNALIIGKPQSHHNRLLRHNHTGFRASSQWHDCPVCFRDRASRCNYYSSQRATVSSYIRQRMLRAGAFQIDIEAAKLLHATLDLPRDNLRSRVCLSAKTLAQRAAKFLTLAEEYAKRRQFARDMAKPPYVRFGLAGTRQLKPSPFESGRNCLPGMERFMDLLT